MLGCTIYICQIYRKKDPWRRFENVLKTSWRCLEDTFARRLKDKLKTSWRRMTKTSILVLIKTSSEDVGVRRIYSSWWRRLEDVFWTRTRKTSSRGLQDVFIKTNVCWVESAQIFEKSDENNINNEHKNYSLKVKSNVSYLAEKTRKAVVLINVVENRCS